MADLNKLVEELSVLTVLEAAELTKLLEAKWGVSAAAPIEAQTEFTVILKEIGAKKIEVIKVIRQLTNLGLKEAKDLAETPNAKVLDLVTKDAAEDAKKKLTDVGATVEVK
jgi:large subunit ribosomal protein L7/L12